MKIMKNMIFYLLWLNVLIALLIGRPLTRCDIAYIGAVWFFLYGWPLYFHGVEK